MNLLTRISMKALTFCAVLLTVFFVFGGAGYDAAVSAESFVPTLVPPTLVPVPESGMIDALPSESVVAVIQREGKVRVGVLYNEPLFGELNIRGEVSGYDADLARAMAEVWGVEAELIQVTRQTALDLLVSGQVDMLLSAMPHHRDLDARVEFSQTYYPSAQMIMVRDGDGATVLDHFNNRIVGVVMGTRGERAVSDWLARSGLNVAVQKFVTLDQALVALLDNQIDGVVESRVRLSRAITDPTIARFVDEPVQEDPYGVVLRRQDVNMRNLVNKTLQHLAVTGKINEIHKTYFNDQNYPEDISVWGGLGEDAPTLDQFATDIPFPMQYVVPRLQQGEVLRIAGLNTLPDNATESQRRWDTFNRDLIEAMVARWGVAVEYIPDSAGNALELVATGQADLAVGVEASWDWADRVDFTSSYFLHGLRVMIKSNMEASSFGGLRGEVIAVFASEGDQMDDLLRAEAQAENALIDLFYLANESDAAFGMLVQDNYHGVFGDSMKMIPHLQAQPEDLKLITNKTNGGWYSRHYIAFAVPRNDIDFRMLVEYTLQELYRDRTLLGLLEPVYPPDESFTVNIWGGPSEYLGFRLAN